MAEEEKINDFLLDQELEPDDIPGDNELPDDIDAILDAVEDEDISVMPKAESSESTFDGMVDEDVLNEAVFGEEDDDFVTNNDLDREVNIAPVGDYDDSIPVINDIIDPNHPPVQSGSGMMTLSEDMMQKVLSRIQDVVEASISKELGKLTATIRDNVVEDVKDQLPAVLNKILKGK